MVTKAQPETTRTAVVAGVIGNILEWYDFGVYAYFAPVIAGLFFPEENATAALLATFAVFAVGFAVRPIGAMIFGHYGDRSGRRNALAATVILMAVSTTLIGILPTYGSVGLAAPILLIVLRLAQGLSAGGEWGGSTSFIVEYAPETRRGFTGSWQQFSVGAGLLLGSLVGTLVTSGLSEAAVEAWGWRVPFLLGILVGFVGLYMRLGLPETPHFRQVEESGAVARSPLAESIREHPRAMGVAIGFTLLWTVSYYIFLTYMPTFVKEHTDIPFNRALLSNVIGLVFFISLIPLMGAISDRIGRKPLLLASAIGLAVLTYPLFLLVSRGVFLLLVLAQLGFAFLEALYSGPGPAAISEIFPTRVRYSALSIGYNLAVTLFGGTAPFIATYLIDVTGNNLAPTLYVIISAIITLLVLLRIPETYREPLK